MKHWLLSDVSEVGGVRRQDPGAVTDVEGAGTCYRAVTVEHILNNCFSDHEHHA